MFQLDAMKSNRTTGPIIYSAGVLVWDNKIPSSPGFGPSPAWGKGCACIPLRVFPSSPTVDSWRRRRPEPDQGHVHAIKPFRSTLKRSGYTVFSTEKRRRDVRGDNSKKTTLTVYLIYFNGSLNIFTTFRKTSFISPIFETADSSLISNYRPVSMISISFLNFFSRLISSKWSRFRSFFLANNYYGFIYSVSCCDRSDHSSNWTHKKT